MKVIRLDARHQALAQRLKAKYSGPTITWTWADALSYQVVIYAAVSCHQLGGNRADGWTHDPDLGFSKLLKWKPDDDLVGVWNEAWDGIDAEFAQGEPT